MVDKKVKVTVRQMIESDFDAVLSLGGDIISRQDLIAWGAGGPLDLSFVAENAGQIIGFNLACVLYYGIPLTKVGVIHGIVVEHEYRRHGIGQALVKEVLKSCREKGVDTLRALVDDDDTPLQQFAEELGFRRSTVANYDMTSYGNSPGC